MAFCNASAGLIMFLPATPMPGLRHIKAFFELTRRPSNALNLVSCVASGNYKNVVRFAELGAVVARQINGRW